MATHLPKGVKTLHHDITRTLVVERQNTATGDTWHNVRTFGPDVSIDHARQTVEDFERIHPDYGPIRLVEYVTTTTQTMEVLD